MSCKKAASNCNFQLELCIRDKDTLSTELKSKIDELKVILNYLLNYFKLKIFK
jgi:hypothetical protein